VDLFVGNPDALWTLAALVPLGVAAAAWALQLACGFCSVDPPEFWHAVTIVVMVAVANTILRFVLHATGAAYGIAPQYLAPLLVTSTVITLGVPTAPFTAVTVTASQLVICAIIYYALLWIRAVFASTLMMF
jgi:hypothetical protein